MLSRINGPQTHMGFEWNPIAQPYIVQFDPDDEDNDVLDAFAAMVMGAPLPAARAPPADAALPAPHQAATPAEGAPPA